MTVKEALKHFDTGDLVSLGFLINFVKNHPAQTKKLLEKHEAVYTKDPLENLNKIITLAGMRTNYFIGDLEDVAQEAHYFSLKDLGDKVKGFIGKTAGAVSTIASPVVTGLTGNPLAGKASEGLLQGVRNLFSKGEDGAAAPDIQTSPAAIQVAETIRTIAEKEADKKDDDKPTFYQQYKTWSWAAVGIILLLIGILLYLRWKKKQKKTN